jgi:hypothetical protein
LSADRADDDDLLLLCYCNDGQEFNIEPRVSVFPSFLLLVSFPPQPLFGVLSRREQHANNN